jgi:hypothetical protein
MDLSFFDCKDGRLQCGNELGYVVCDQELINADEDSDYFENDVVDMPNKEQEEQLNYDTVLSLIPQGILNEIFLSLPTRMPEECDNSIEAIKNVLNIYCLQHEDYKQKDVSNVCKDVIKLWMDHKGTPFCNVRKHLNNLEIILLCSKLRFIDLRDVPDFYSNDLLDALSRCWDAETILVSGCISDMHIKKLKFYRKLKKLSISEKPERFSDSRFTGDCFEQLKELTNLESLDLINCGQLRRASVKVIGSLTKLRKLSFVQSRAMHNYRKLTNLKNLEDLVVASPLVTTDIRAIGELSKLKSLKILTEIKFKIADLECLTNLGNLTSMDFSAGGDFALEMVSLAKARSYERFTAARKEGANLLADIPSDHIGPIKEYIDAIPQNKGDSRVFWEY